MRRKRTAREVLREIGPDMEAALDSALRSHRTWEDGRDGTFRMLREQFDARFEVRQLRVLVNRFGTWVCAGSE